MISEELEAELLWSPFSLDFELYGGMWEDNISPDLLHTVSANTEKKKYGHKYVNNSLTDRSDFMVNGIPEIDDVFWPFDNTVWLGVVDPGWLKIYYQAKVTNSRFGLTELGFRKITEFVAASTEERRELLIEIELSR